jgi:hypothetical protein
MARLEIHSVDLFSILEISLALFEVWLLKKQMNLQISAVLVVSSAHLNCVLMVTTIDRKRHRERE